jgi:hypothetical protein
MNYLSIKLVNGLRLFGGNLKFVNLSPVYLILTSISFEV